RFREQWLANLAGLPRLRQLALAECTIGDDGLRHLGKMKSLEHVTLDWTEITDAGVARLAPLKRLRRLFLSHTRIGDEGARVLGGLPALEELALNDTMVSDDAAGEVRRRHPRAKIQHPRADRSPMR